jgi:FMN phosphatase YigB (HAD superfamily)
VIKSVVFDVGETLLDDTREFAAWASRDRTRTGPSWWPVTTVRRSGDTGRCR